MLTHQQYKEYSLRRYRDNVVVCRLEKTVWEYFIKSSFSNFRTEEGLNKVRLLDYRNY